MNFCKNFLPYSKLLEYPKHELKKSPLINISLPNYTFLDADSTTSAGGFGISIANDVPFSLIGG